MRPAASRVGAASAALLIVYLGGASCGPGLPPEPTTSCADGSAPEGEETLLLSRPLDGATPLQANDTLPLEYGPQGGQHVMVGIRQFAADAATWVYRINFQQAEAPMGSGPLPVALEGSNTLAVKTCAAGWTDTTAPVFMDIYYNGASEGDVATIAGVLRVVATTDTSTQKLTVEKPVIIEID